MDIDTGNGRPGRAAAGCARVWREFLAALDTLPPEARAVVLLHDVFGIDLDEIASLVGLHPVACRRRLEQARACLRARAPHLE